MTENQPGIIAQAIELSAPLNVVNNEQADNSLRESCDQQVILDRTQDETHQSSAVPVPVINLPVSKEAGTQTESFSSISMMLIERSLISTNGINSGQLTTYGQASITSNKRSTSSWSLKYHCLIQKNITSTFTSFIDKRYTGWVRIRPRIGPLDFFLEIPYICMRDDVSRWKGPFYAKSCLFERFAGMCMVQGSGWDGLKPAQPGPWAAFY
jgi:hypothetical protein